MQKHHNFVDTEAETIPAPPNYPEPYERNHHKTPTILKMPKVTPVPFFFPVLEKTEQKFSACDWCGTPNVPTGEKGTCYCDECMETWVEVITLDSSSDNQRTSIF